MIVASSEKYGDYPSVFDQGLRFAQSQWHCWGDLTSASTLYQMGFDAWRHCSELQFSLWESWWRLGALMLESSPGRQALRVEPEVDATKPALKRAAAR